MISVRLGTLVTKEYKGWDIDIERLCRFLCVEDIFNTNRNLSNSADFLSVDGLLDEFRRAANMLYSHGDLDQVCEEYKQSYYPNPLKQESLSDRFNRQNVLSTTSQSTQTTQNFFDKEDKEKKKITVWTNHSLRHRPLTTEDKRVNTIQTMFEGLFQPEKQVVEKKEGKKKKTKRLRSNSLPVIKICEKSPVKEVQGKKEVQEEREDQDKVVKPVSYRDAVISS